MPVFNVRDLPPGGIDARLELGHVACVDDEPFAILAQERHFLSPAWSLGGAKNIALRAGERSVRGASGSPSELADIAAMMSRYADVAEGLLDRLVPRYRPGRTRGSTSFRPCEIAGRATSWRSDDTRLHVDAFPSNPVQGRRILRVFTNVNPGGAAREWMLGEPFESFSRRFFPRARSAVPGSARMMRSLGLTKSVRSDYDHFMLQLHDLAKGDDDYQRAAPRERAHFAPGTTWIVFSDQAVHAATAGQYALEQTFYVDVDRMADVASTPLAVLERLAGRSLA
jgi:hypothetical protein